MVPCRSIPTGIVLLSLVLPNGLEASNLPLKGEFLEQYNCWAPAGGWTRAREGLCSISDICGFHGINPSSNDDITKDPLWQRHYGVRPVVQLDPTDPTDEVVLNLAGEEQYI